MAIVGIIAEIEVKPGHRDGLMPAFKALVGGSCSESGNKLYNLTENTAHPGHFFVIEEWLSAEALVAHNNSKHFRNFITAMKGKSEKLNITKVETMF